MWHENFIRLEVYILFPLGKIVLGDHKKVDCGETVCMMGQAWCGWIDVCGGGEKQVDQREKLGDSSARPPGSSRKACRLLHHQAGLHGQTAMLRQPTGGGHKGMRLCAHSGREHAA